MLRRARGGNKRAWAAAALLALLASAGPAAAWQVYVDQVDMTGAAAPAWRGNTLVANASVLGPMVGVTARAAGGQAEVIDREGRTWRGLDNGSTLESGGRSISLAFPLQLQGPSVLLPVDAISELSGLHLELDRAQQRAVLSRGDAVAAAPKPAPAPDDADAPDGWQPLVIDKTAEQKAELAKEMGSGALTGRAGIGAVRLPPSHDRVRFGAGVGYVQGADAGLELTSTGHLFGRQLDAYQLVTAGGHGMVLRNTRLTLYDREAGWGAEGGQMCSDVWGMRSGLRWAWEAGERRWPSLSLYLPESSRERGGLALSYRDEAKLSKRLTVGGEVATTGAAQLRSALQFGQGSLYLYGRAGVSPGEGAFLSYPLPWGITLYGGYNRGEGSTGRSIVQNLAVRLPLWKGMDLTLDQTDTRLDSQHSTLTSATLGVPVGPLRLMARYQFGSSSLRPPDPLDPWMAYATRELTGTIGYSGAGRLHLDYQMRMQWQNAGQGPLWNQVVTSYSLDRRTELQAITGFPNLADPEEFRLRVDHRLAQDLSVMVDYGRLAPFQSTALAAGERGFKVMLRKEWGISTPAGGGTIRGTVKDQANRPVPGVIVRWNGYSAVTDKKGAYVMAHIPAGSHRLILDASSLPADYRVDEGERQVKINGQRFHTVNFRVIPLNTVSGVVYWDKNGNGKCDPGEGIAGAAIHLNGFATASGADGLFAFYNVEPGPHVIRIDTERLPEGFVLSGPAEASAELLPDRPLSGIVFQVTRRQKPVIFQDLP